MSKLVELSTKDKHKVFVDSDKVICVEGYVNDPTICSVGIVGDRFSVLQGIIMPPEEVARLVNEARTNNHE